MSIPLIGRPSAGEHDSAFDRYVARVPEIDILSALGRQKEEFHQFISAIGEQRAGYRYAEGKWSIRQVVGHIIDSERVFGYRALCVARGEQGALPGFDENQWAAGAGIDLVTLSDLLDEFRSLRESHQLMFSHLRPEAWLRSGTANGFPITARALAYIMAGHARHHVAVLTDRYLVSP